MAFGIEAAWSEQQERADEEDAIAQLRADFTDNAARLDTVRLKHEEALEASYEILALADLGGEAQGTRLTGVVVRNSLQSWTYDPVLGGINSLIQSGSLGILRNEALRVAIAGWPDIVADLNEDEIREARTTFERMAPYLEERGVMFDLLVGAGRLERLGPRPAPDLSSLLSDPLYLQMISWRVNNLQNVLPEIETVDLSIQGILRLLEES